LYYLTGIAVVCVFAGMLGFSQATFSQPANVPGTPPAGPVALPQPAAVPADVAKAIADVIKALQALHAGGQTTSDSLAASLKSLDQELAPLRDPNDPDYAKSMTDALAKYLGGLKDDKSKLAADGVNVARVPYKWIYFGMRDLAEISASDNRDATTVDLYKNGNIVAPIRLNNSSWMTALI
jgi:hypothetical protein